MFDVKPKIIDSQDLINISEQIPKQYKKEKKVIKKEKKIENIVEDSDVIVSVEKKIKIQNYPGIDIPWVF